MARACPPRSPHVAPEHWQLGDWLAARVPVGVRGRKTGTGPHVRRARAPRRRQPQSPALDPWHRPPLAARDRVPAAPFDVHGALRNGGRERAGRRRDRLLETEPLHRQVAAALARNPRRVRPLPRSTSGADPGRPSSRRRSTPSPARLTARSAPAPHRRGEGGPRCYLSALRAADVHAFVMSRRKFAWAVAMLETHSMSLDPGPRSRESETALRVDS